MTKKKKSGKKCLNCGAVCHSHYCPECGQSLAVGRLHNRTFFVDLITGLLRINRGFLFTASNLLVHPWQVIRHYIKGRRVEYTPPLNMLILLCFFATIISGFTTAELAESPAQVPEGVNPSAFSAGMLVGHFLKSSPVIQNILLYLPALLAVPIVYGRRGARRYNFAELFSALIYMVDTLLIFNIITIPLHYLLPDDFCSVIDFVYTLAIIGISLHKAFPTGTIRGGILHFAAYLLTVLGIYILIVLAIFTFAAG